LKIVHLLAFFILVYVGVEVSQVNLLQMHFTPLQI
jgi:hypothetical protein